jgi:hypothetical protein
MKDEGCGPTPKTLTLRCEHGDCGHAFAAPLCRIGGAPWNIRASGSMPALQSHIEVRHRSKRRCQMDWRGDVLRAQAGRLVPDSSLDRVRRKPVRTRHLVLRN